MKISVINRVFLFKLHIFSISYFRWTSGKFWYCFIICIFKAFVVKSRLWNTGDGGNFVANFPSSEGSDVRSINPLRCSLRSIHRNHPNSRMHCRQSLNLRQTSSRFWYKHFSKYSSASVFCSKTSCFSTETRLYSEFEFIWLKIFLEFFSVIITVFAQMWKCIWWISDVFAFAYDTSFDQSILCGSESRKKLLF